MMVHKKIQEVAGFLRGPRFCTLQVVFVRPDSHAAPIRLYIVLSFT